MIRILTIHHETDRFLNLQRKYIEKYTNDYIVYCGYTKFNPPNLGENNRNIDLNQTTLHHAGRLNHMFNNVVKKEGNDEDILIFMDSDTFPIVGNWVDVIVKNLKINPITAIQRKENSAAGLGCKPELHPHICFFSTTIGFWVKNNLTIGGVPNTAYNIGEWLKANNLDFTKILRSNAIDLHPLYFGVYENILYHHGSGNRIPYDGVDICNRPGLGCGVEMNKKYPKILDFNQKLSDLVFSEINNNDDFIRNYLMGIK